MKKDKQELKEGSAVVVDPFLIDVEEFQAIDAEEEVIDEGDDINET